MFSQPQSLSFHVRKEPCRQIVEGEWTFTLTKLPCCGSRFILLWTKDNNWITEFIYI